MTEELNREELIQLLRVTQKKLFKISCYLGWRKRIPQYVKTAYYLIDDVGEGIKLALTRPNFKSIPLEYDKRIWDHLNSIEGDWIGLHKKIKKKAKPPPGTVNYGERI